MPLTPEQEWIIAACGLIAHADGDLSTGESDQMLVMLEERLTPAEHARWVALLADGPALARAFAELPPPLPAFTEPLLEKAWTMALADGHASEAELRELERIADELGISAGELAGWRRHWTEHAVELAEHTAAFAAVLVHHDGTVDPEEATQFRALLGRLPLSPHRREQLATSLLASARLDGTGPGSGSSWDPSLSADGRWLAFVSVATNLTAELPQPRPPSQSACPSPSQHTNSNGFGSATAGTNPSRPSFSLATASPGQWRQTPASLV